MHTILDIFLIDGKIETQHSRRFIIDHETKTSSQKVLFDFIANSVAKFIKEEEIKEKLLLGFTFPMEHESINSGKLIYWMRGCGATRTKEEDVVQLLKAAFDRREVSIL